MHDDLLRATELDGQRLAVDCVALAQRERKLPSRAVGDTADLEVLAVEHDLPGVLRGLDIERRGALHDLLVEIGSELERDMPDARLFGSGEAVRVLRVFTEKHGRRLWRGGVLVLGCTTGGKRCEKGGGYEFTQGHESTGSVLRARTGRLGMAGS